VHLLTRSSTRLESSRAQRILVLLEELNLSHEIKPYKRSKDGLAPPELGDVHPLGKSPVVTISSPTQGQPLVLAETGAIVGEFSLDPTNQLISGPSSHHQQTKTDEYWQSTSPSAGANP